MSLRIGGFLSDSFLDCCEICLSDYSGSVRFESTIVSLVLDKLLFSIFINLNGVEVINITTLAKRTCAKVS